MYLTKTPFRISFFGGGTDLPEFYKNYGGCVVSSTIDKYIYLAINKQFERKGYNLKYKINELPKTINSIKHPIIKEVFKKYKIHDVVLSSIADLPSNSGMGSSSAFTVGLLKLCAAYGEGLDLKKRVVSEDACEIEITKLKEPIGKQDQYASGYGGFNKIHFSKEGKVEIEPINLKSNFFKLENNLLLFHLGGLRKASSVLKDQIKQIKTKNSSVQNSIKLKEIAKDFDQKKLIKNIDLFGELLNENWEFKKSISKNISSPYIDEFYKTALSSGAIGGKLLGAGGGGFFLIYAKQKDQKKIIKKLNKFNLVNFSFENKGVQLFKI